MATITLTEYADGRIFQRKTNEKADITISGTYTESPSPTSIEARIVYHSTSNEVITWTEIDSSPSGGVFSGELEVPQGYWYDIQVRFSNDVSVVDNGINKFGVGLIFLCSGASNMYRMFSEGYSLLSASNGTRWMRAVDGYSWNILPEYDGAIKLANTINNALSAPVALLDTNIGGMAILEKAESSPGKYWLNEAEGTQYDNLKTLVENAGGSVEGVLWMQGEREALDDHDFVTQTEYYNGLTQFVSNLRRDLDYPQEVMPFYVGIIGRYTSSSSTDERWTTIKNAILQFYESDDNVFIGCVAHTFNLSDGIHYNIASRTIEGNRYAQSILESMGETSDGYGPRILYHEQVDSTNVDVVIQHSNGTDFTPTSNISGFSVLDDGVAKGISIVNRQDANTIRITVASALTGEITVRYMYGQSPNVGAYVRDNTTTALPLWDDGDIDLSTTTSTSTSSSTTTTSSSTTTTSSSTTTTTSSSTSTSSTTTTPFSYGIIKGNNNEVALKGEGLVGTIDGSTNEHIKKGDDYSVGKEGSNNDIALHSN
jgi:hypothetical protein